MSIYTSTRLSRKKAMQIVSEAMGDDDDLKAMLNVILEKYTYRNCCRILEEGQPNEDDDSGVARWRDRVPM